MTDVSVSSWFPTKASDALGTVTVRLFCFPHGGGDASTFRNWPRAIGGGIEIVAAALPGRERRIAEPLVLSIDRLADLLAGPVRDRAGDLPIVLFGHSMGALVAFELAHRLIEVGRPPALLVVSGAQPPQLRSSAPKVHGLPDDEFLSYVSTLEGTPAGVLDVPDLRELLLPVLRADFQACETYTLADRPRLDLPILVLGGDEDPRVPVNELFLWSELTSGQSDVVLFDGGHFFVLEQLDEVAEAVCGAIRSVVGEGVA